MTIIPRHGYVYLLKHKSEALKKFKNYKTKVEKQLGRPIKSINNDKGGEYDAFDEFCRRGGGGGWKEFGIFTLCLTNLKKMVLLKDAVEL